MDIYMYYIHKSSKNTSLINELYNLNFNYQDFLNLIRDYFKLSSIIIYESLKNLIIPIIHF